MSGSEHLIQMEEEEGFFGTPINLFHFIGLFLYLPKYQKTRG